MTILVALVLTVLAFVVVAYPFFRQRPRLAGTGDDKLRELNSKRDTSYSMLKELEFDLQAGILTEENYQELERRYRKKAISILKEIDDSKKDVEVDDEIERRVRELRRGKSSKVDEELEKEVLKLRRRRGRFCPKCGAGCQEGDRFCSRCGTPLRQGG